MENGKFGLFLHSESEVLFNGLLPHLLPHVAAILIIIHSLYIATAVVNDDDLSRCFCFVLSFYTQCTTSFWRLLSYLNTLASHT